MDGTGTNSLGISTKEEVIDKIEPNGMISLGISIKEEAIDEIVANGVNSLGISVKEEVTDETETNGVCNLDVSIKEEMTNGTYQSNLSTIPTMDIKEEERLDIYYGGLVHVKQEEELNVPDNDAKYILNETDQLKGKIDIKIPVMVHHTGEKPQQCPHCEYKSAHLGRLNKHIMARHNGEKSHQCPS
ncbi:uncharacterized protein [Halyomorpha halys]|uniref:uncharacterized protein n=1 Tax=Halyomorpha halys TaxID=286706 RepID=UPI0006D4EBCE|nr:uncharacterized protein LOC106678093 [Halyomorpha halys]